MKRKRILILACSATKKPEPLPMPAFYRYDGPAWRTLRANVPAPLPFETFALSAEHGLIPGFQPITNYDRPMTTRRVRELYDVAGEQLTKIIRQVDMGEHIAELEIFAVGGKLYRRLLAGARDCAEVDLDRLLPITFSSGGIGEQLGQLKAWLRREA